MAAKKSDTIGEKTITVTQVRSTIATKPKTRGTMRALGLRKIGDTQHAARPQGDPRHDRPGRSPHHRRRRD